MTDVLEEDRIYVHAKRLLRGSGWILLGGQPPRGCDHLPVIEVKAVRRTSLGSKGAYKPDLVAYKEGLFLLVECKPHHHEGDASKLREILQDEERIGVLYQEMDQRGLFLRHKIYANRESFRLSLRGALAHGGLLVPQDDLYVLHISADPERSRLVAPGVGADR